MSGEYRGMKPAKQLMPPPRPNHDGPDAWAARFAPAGSGQPCPDPECPSHQVLHVHPRRAPQQVVRVDEQGRWLDAARPEVSS